MSNPIQTSCGLRLSAKLIEARLKRCANRLCLRRQADPAGSWQRAFLPGPFVVDEERAGAGLALGAQQVS